MYGQTEFFDLPTYYTLNVVSHLYPGTLSVQPRRLLQFVYDACICQLHQRTRQFNYDAMKARTRQINLLTNKTNADPQAANL